MKYLKLIDVLEHDYTPKKNTHVMDYSDIKGKIFEEIMNIQAGTAMLLSMVNCDYPLRTSRVNRTEGDNRNLNVWTNNTLYQFEIINTYQAD